MSSKDWKTYKLGEIATFSYGKMPKKENLGKGSYPTFSGYRYQYKYPEFNCKKGDIILVARGVGGTGDVKVVKEDCYLTNLSIKINLNDNVVLNLFFYYQLLPGTLRHLDSGSAQSQITIDDLKRIDISLPAISIQQQIASILSSLDDKIEVNRQTNQTLEGIAQTLFQEMCVPKGEELPEGWRIGKLRDIVEINPKLALKKGSISKYIEMKDLSENSMIIKRCIDREFASGSKFQNGDTLLARITPCLENGKTGMVNLLEGDEVGWGSTEFIVLREKKGLGEYFVYCLARTNAFREYAIQSMVGSSGRQRVVDSILADFDLGIPTENTLKNFHNAVKPLFEQIFSLEQETQTLIALRDSLLPKLMKGEIEI